MPEIALRGTRLHAQLLGDSGPERPLVLFLHGLVMDNLSSWFFTLATPMAREATVLLHDLRGHGRSARPESGYAVSEMVADLHALRRELQLLQRPAWLIGNSFGGLLALAYAMEHPEHTAGLVLVDGQVADRPWAEGMVRSLGLEGAERDQMIAQRFEHWLGRHSPRKATRLARTARELVYGTSLVQDLAATPPFSDAALAAITQPVLGLYGSDSDVRPQAERLEHLLPRFELHLLEGATHSVLWERTAELKALVRSWLRARWQEAR